MLKFFRQYNKWFLAVGGTLLMIAFLIQPAMSIFVPQPENQEIGQIDGEEVTLGDRIQAANEVQILEVGFPLLRAMLPLEQGDEGMQYLLMQREAAALGVSASEAEVDQVLLDLQIGPAEMAQLLQRMRTTEASIREVLRRWIVVQNYMPLIRGRAYMPLQQRMQTTLFAYQMAQVNPLQAMEILALTQGSPRISEPLLAQFIASQQATLGGEVVLIGHEQYLDQVGEPTDEQLTQLFNQYRDNLPGTVSDENPFGFGYRTPARVKIEWLHVPAEAVAAKVQIDEAEALDYFEANKPQYADAAPGAADPTYGQVRDQVIADLRRRETQELAAQAARVAQAAMQEDSAVRRLPRDGAYAAVPADFAPLSLHDAAARVTERTGITPVVRGASDTWTSVAEVSTLPGIGMTTLVGRSGVGFEDYIQSARELEPASDNPLVPLRLQRGVPSELLRGFDGSYYVFRLVAAEPAQAPETLSAVRDQVVQDWRKLQAYERLQQERERLVQMARERGLQAVADETKAPMLHVGPVARREASMMGVGLETPTLAGIGQSDALLDAMFEVAEGVAAGEGQPLGSLTAVEEAARVGAAPVDPRLSLAVFRIDSYQPITRDTYEQAARSPFAGASLDRVLLQDSDENPLSIQAIAARIGYTGEGLEPENGEAEAGMSAADAG